MGTDGRAELRDALVEYRDLAERLCQLEAEVAAVRETARSANGVATATVNSNGTLVDLKIDGRRRADLPTITAAVLEASGLATGQVRRRIGAYMASSLPPHLKRLIGPDGLLDTAALRPHLIPNRRGA
jgi:DNA-binding protein YbaB